MSVLNLNPFVRNVGEQFENILNGRFVPCGSSPGRLLNAVLDSAQQQFETAGADPAAIEALHLYGFLVDPGVDIFAQSNLKYISLETSSICNQRCYFCPVSEELLPTRELSLECLDDIVRQAMQFPNFVGLFLNHYNEPFADGRMPEILDRIKRHGAKVAINTNGSISLNRFQTPIGQRQIDLVTVNLHTVEREKYRAERGRDHMDAVVRNVRMYHAAGIANELRVVVLAISAEEEAASTAAVKAAFADLDIEIFGHRIGDRCGAVRLPPPWQPLAPHRVLSGCEQTGSRVLEHLHILADGRAIICCEDYHGDEIVGHVERQSLKEILASEPFKIIRRKVYGAEAIASNFICARCEYALPGRQVRQHGTACLTPAASAI